MNVDKEKILQCFKVLYIFLKTDGSSNAHLSIGVYHKQIAYSEFRIKKKKKKITVFQKLIVAAVFIFLQV